MDARTWKKSAKWRIVPPVLAVAALMFAPVLFQGAAQAAGTAGPMWQPPQPPTNAALVYNRAFLVTSPLRDSENQAANDAFAEFEKKGVYDASRLDPFVQRNKEAIVLLLQASGIAKCDFGVQFDQSYTALLPELARARELGRIGVLAARRAQNAGDWRQSSDILSAVLHLAQGVHEESTVIGGLVGARLIEMTSKEIGAMLAAMPGDAAVCSTLAARLESVTPVMTDWSGPIEGEIKINAAMFPAPGVSLTREQLLERVAKLYTFDAFANLPPRKTLEDLIEGKSTPEQREALAAILACKAGDLASLEAINNMLQEVGSNLITHLKEIQTALALPYAQAAAHIKGILQEAAKNPIEPALIPATESLLYQKASVSTRLAMLRMALDAACWRAAHGSWPATTQELGISPSDPFADDQPLQYQAVGQRGFTITSKGPDTFNGTTPLTFTVTTP